MKKLLVITKNIQPDSGMGRFSLEVLRALSKEGYGATVLVERGSVYSEIPKGAVIAPVLYRADSLWRVLANAYTTRKFARGHNRVHAFDGWPFAIYGYAGVIGTRRRLFVSALGSYAVAPLQGGMKRVMLARAYQRAAQVFCISAYTQTQLIKTLPLTNTKVAHLATSALVKASPTVAQALLERYPQAAQRPLFLTIGQIKERKGQLDTLKALELLKAKYPHFLYVMIGWDERKEYVESIRTYAAAHGLEENILIISDSLDDSVPAFFYERCDIFLLNANNEKGHFEGFGLVVLEAAQYGKPAIGSRDCGIEDAISDGYSGFVTGQKNHQEIADKVEAILSDQASFSRNAKEFASHFTWEKTAQAYAAEYET